MWSYYMAVKRTPTLTDKSVYLDSFHKNSTQDLDLTPIKLFTDKLVNDYEEGNVLKSEKLLLFPRKQTGSG